MQSDEIKFEQYSATKHIVQNHQDCLGRTPRRFSYAEEESKPEQEFLSIYIRHKINFMLN